MRYGQSTRSCQAARPAASAPRSRPVRDRGWPWIEAGTDRVDDDPSDVRGAVQHELVRQRVERVGERGERPGLILLDRQGRMPFANPAAETMLAANDGLAARDRDLRVGLPETERRYRAMLARALDPARQAPTATPEFLRVPRPSGSGLPYVLSVTRCPPSERMMSGEPPAALLTIVDPERRQAPAAKLLRTGFGLSAQEAALTARLCAGETLDEAARRLGIGRETARTHLSGAFAKTGTRRQHALVALLNSALVGLG